MHVNAPTPVCTSEGVLTRVLIIGVCALDKKARSKPMRNLLDRLNAMEEFRVISFGDKVIIEEAVENWPHCDFFISFFSCGLPFEKVLKYVELRKPFCINDIPLQQILWDRRIVLMVLDALDVPTPSRVIVNRDSGPKISLEIKRLLAREFNIFIDAKTFQQEELQIVDDDTIKVGNKILKKPFVEKPVSGEDHNIYVYYPSSGGGGARKLFRKVADKSSVFDPTIKGLRTKGSFVYEEFVSSSNFEDVKVYTIGPDESHAETRKSPVVDGIVLRNSDGKEVRHTTVLSEEEKEISKTISMAFGQTICGFDLLRNNGRSIVIDVNGWAFVKGNSNEYYQKCASVMRDTFLRVFHMFNTCCVSPPKQPSQWSIKAHIAVVRHADRTPKRKIKINLKASYEFIAFFTRDKEKRQDLLVSGSSDLKMAAQYIKNIIVLQAEPQETADKLQIFHEIIDQKYLDTHLKLQIRFNIKSSNVQGIVLILKWGGEFTHSGRHQSIDFGDHLRRDLLLLDPEILNDVKFYHSEEHRVLATADAFAKSLLQLAELPSDLLQVKNSLLDWATDAKDIMDSCKKILNKAIVSPEYMLPDALYGPYYEKSETPYSALKLLVEEMLCLKSLFDENITKIDWDADLFKWCCAESPLVFLDRWKKIFEDFSVLEKVEVSKLNDLYDCLKYDSLHNKDVIQKLFYSASNQLHHFKKVFEQCEFLFRFIAPQEYGVTLEQKKEIGMKNALPLLKSILENLNQATSATSSFSRFYFTKESHMYSFLNLLLLSSLETAPLEGLMFKELDYMSHLTLEIFERNFSDKKEFSLRIGLSDGAHVVGNIVELQNLDLNHTISTNSKKWISPHLKLEDAVEKLTKDYFDANCSQK